MSRSLLQFRLLHSLPSPPLPLFTDIDSLLRLCTTITHIHQTHAFIIRRCLHHHNPFLLARLIDACSSLGFPDYAFSLFTHHNSQSNPNTYLYNTAINALSLSPSRSPTEVVYLFNKIRFTGLKPDTYSFPFVLKSVVRLSDVDLGREIHCQALWSGLVLDVNVVTALVDMYSKFGCIFRARQMFDEMFNKHVALWNAMVSGYAKAGDMDNARDMFDRMPERNVISWTVVITGYVRMRRSREAVAMFWRMLQLEERKEEDRRHRHVKPNEVTMLAALSACADLGALEAGKWIHRYVDEHGLFKTVRLSNALINMYAKSGSIGMALGLFENTEQKSVVTWSTMIDGLAHHGLVMEALEMFFHMERAKFKPSEITFTAILSACSHAGLVEIGLGFFNRMRSRYRINPRIEHYGCIVGLVGRAGYLQRALEIVTEMPVKANAAIWASLLAAAKMYGNAEFAEHALQHLAKVEPHNGGNDTVLCETYTDFGRWDEARTVREAMSNGGVKTAPEGSSIEVNSMVHEFLTGDISHPQSERICEVIDQINCHLNVVVIAT